MTCTLLFFTALKAHRLSNKNTRKTANPSSAPVLSTTPSTVIKGINSQEIPIDVTNGHVNSPTTAFTAGYQLKDKTVSQRIRPLLLENTALVKETNTLSTLRLNSVISKDAQHQTGTTVTYTVGPKGPVLSSTRLPVKASVLLPEAKETEKTADPLPNTAKQNQTSLTVKRGTIGRTEAKVNIQARTPPAVHGAKNNTTTTGDSPSPGLNHAVPTRLPFENSREPVTETHISSVKLRIQTSPINSQAGVIKDDIGSHVTTQNPQCKPLLVSQTSSNKSTPLNQASPSRPLPQPHIDESQTPFSPATLSMPIFKTPTLPTEVIRPSESSTLQSTDEPSQVLTLQPIGELLEPQPNNSVSEPTNKPPQFQSEVPLSTSTLLQSGTRSNNSPEQTIPTQTEGQNRIFQTPTSDTPHMYPWSQALFQTSKPMTQTAQWRRTQIPITRLSSASRSDQKLTKDFTPQMSETISETISSTYASIPSSSPSSFLVSTQQLSAAVPVSSFTSSRSSKSLAMSLVQTFSSPPSKAPTAAKLANLPTPSPISIPPHIAPAPLPVPASSALSPLNSSRSPAHPSSISPSSSFLSPLKLSNSITSSYVSLLSSFTLPPSIFSIDSASPSSSSSSSSVSTSTSSSSISTQDSASSSTSPSPMFSETTSRHHRPSPVPRRSHNHHLTSTSPPLTSQQPTKKLLIRVTSLEPDPKPNVPTPGILHSPAKVHPNFDPNLKPNFDNKAKPNPAHIDTNLKNPSSTPANPVKEGKYPDIIPRNSTWVLGMLLGCSACLGMIVVVGLRYMYRQVCGKRTEVTLNDREREYGGGERGLIHVQECGDLVRVRRIRDNSFVFLAEYDIIASAGD